MIDKKLLILLSNSELSEDSLRLDFGLTRVYPMPLPEPVAFKMNKNQKQTLHERNYQINQRSDNYHCKMKQHDKISKLTIQRRQIRKSNVLLHF